MKLGLSLFLLLACIQLSLAGRAWQQKLHKHGSKKLTNIKIKLGNQWKGQQKKMKDFTKASNPEMMLMMRMKKMIFPLRELFTTVLDLGRPENIEGRPAFCGKSECPAFKVINKTAHYELRHYEASTWVSTSEIAPSLNSEVQGSLFWPLFNYFQGDNKKGSRIEMTVPVTNFVRPHPSTDGFNFTMSFFVSPSIRNPPAPNNDKVFIKHKPSFKVYAHSFKGYAWNQHMWEKHADMLMDHLNKDGLKGKYHPRDHMYVTAGYNDPLQMFNRHNEVWLMVWDK